jgi:D-beta-D-heptose 7-phosphate kinase/D-beta-D-heptose 1-phosphate adenosyltransferase
MPNSHTIEELSQGEKDSVLYHDIFDYPLDFSELIKWKVGKKSPVSTLQGSVIRERGFYLLRGREGLIYKRLLRKRASDKKKDMARRASKLLSFIPWVKMIGLTGSLSMENSTEESDIDLFFITKNGKLWTTRIFCYVVLWLNGYETRKPNNKDQRDKLCLNMWLDETDLMWPKNDRNLYTAHEIAQIVPLINKDKTYENFLFLNKWILDYWPNSVRILNLESGIWNSRTKFKILNSIFSIVEKFAFRIQYGHMKPKITREVVTKTRAIFHPQDLSKKVLERLS